jgi:hypothetical protein
VRLFFLVLLAPAGIRANSYFVSLAGSATPPYDTWAKAATNIQSALDRAEADMALGASDGVVWVTAGVYMVSSQIEVRTNITLRAAGTNPADTVIQGSYPGVAARCLFLSGTNAVVDGFTITNGFADASTPLTNYGGGVYLVAGTLRNSVVVGNVVGSTGARAPGIYLAGPGVVSNCLIIQNRSLVAANGGGAYVSGGGLLTHSRVFSNSCSTAGGAGGGLYVIGGTVSNCVVANNLCRSSAGVYVTSGGVVVDCLIHDNRSSTVGYDTPNQPGGGLVLTGTGLASNCTVANVRTTSYGSGINFSSGGTAHGCIVVSNTASEGVVYMNNGQLRNCLVAGNSLALRGAVRMTDNGIIESCTIVRNQAGVESGGLHVSVVDGVLRNTIIWDNDAPANPNWTMPGGTILHNCSWPLMPGGVNQDAPPQFVASGSGYGVTAVLGDYRMWYRSSCIDMGLNQNWMTNALDLAGQPRIYPTNGAGVVDIGAFEFVPPPSGLVLQVR